MDAMIDSLQRYYQSFIVADPGISRHILLDYLEYIRSMPELMAIILPLEEKREGQKKWFIENEPKPTKNAADDSLALQMYSDGFTPEIMTELWGCWHRLSWVCKEWLIDEDIVWDMSTTDEFLQSPPTYEVLKSAASRIHNHLLTELSKMKNVPIVDNDGSTLLLEFDAARGIIMRGSKECPLPYKKIEYFVVSCLFAKKFGTRFTETELEDYVDMLGPKGKSRRIYDAHNRINEKVREKLGIARLIHCENSNYWIDPSPLRPD